METRLFEGPWDTVQVLWTTVKFKLLTCPDVLIWRSFLVFSLHHACGLFDLLILCYPFLIDAMLHTDILPFKHCNWKTEYWLKTPSKHAFDRFRELVMCSGHYCFHCWFVLQTLNPCEFFVAYHLVCSLVTCIKISITCHRQREFDSGETFFVLSGTNFFTSFIGWLIHNVASLVINIMLQRLGTIPIEFL